MLPTSGRLTEIILVDGSGSLAIAWHLNSMKVVMIRATGYHVFLVTTAEALLDWSVSRLHTVVERRHGQPKRSLTIIHLFFPASDLHTPDSQHDHSNNFSFCADAQHCVPSIRQWLCFCRPATLQRRPSKATQPIVAHKPRQDASPRRAKRAPWLYELLDAGD